MFGRDLENIYDINFIHNNEVNNIAEWNFLHDILNTSKRQYYPILYIFMNTIMGGENLKIFDPII